MLQTSVHFLQAMKALTLEHKQPQQVCPWHWAFCYFNFLPLDMSDMLPDGAVGLFLLSSWLLLLALKFVTLRRLQSLEESILQRFQRFDEALIRLKSLEQVLGVLERHKVDGILGYIGTINEQLQRLEHEYLHQIEDAM